MKFLVGVSICVFFAFSALIYWVDKIFDLVSQTRRYHIGRWDNREQWETAVVKRACRWIQHTPIVRLSDNSRYRLLDLLKGKYRNATIQSWQIAGLALGLIDYSKNKDLSYFPGDFAEKYISEEGEWRCTVNRVDYAMLAYVILKTTSDPKKIYPAMKKMVNVIEGNLCSDGMISYSQGNQSKYRYVDTLGMVCPFLTLYGRIYNCSQYIILAIEQIKKYHCHGFLHGTQLPCHAYNVENNLPVGIYGWGRGTAWYFIAVLDTWKELSESNQRNELKSYLYEAAQTYTKYQQNDGGFNTILQGGGQYDSSITAAMAYFFQSCSNIFSEKRYKDIAEKSISKLMTVTMKSGAVDVCQGDTHGLGIFSQIYDVMPFAQGLLLRALAINTEGTFDEAVY
ncbi:hypothetical protein BHF69_05390 [Anaerostipes sp. 992a]|uniref:glycoside hydrolase family 88 protein n=1 Tax=Anaerostipes sp. 992a TaxID=1261637 RepID=UPI000951CF4D|nr:glycoside hydrolase family 88 protein [Anaerostipes sp. 992a]OLR62164.1 hypothetical protein BHF69_05390 [Anaerostipes sp. 992a]